jgi:type IX secretion system substrate protein
MTVQGFYRVIPLRLTRSSRFIVLLLIWLTIGLPNTLSASNERLECSYPTREFPHRNRQHSDAISALELFLTSNPESKAIGAALVVVCPDDFSAECNSPEAATPMTLAEFEAAGGSISTTCSKDFIRFGIDEKSSGGCPEIITRIVYVGDLCGNVASCSYTMTLEGYQEPPIVKCPADITVNCVGDVPDADVGAVDAEAICGTVRVTHLGDDTSRLGLCPGIIYRSYMAQDQCGNTATCVQTITVNNNCDPDDPCAGICDIDVPVFTVDLSGSPDNQWMSPVVVSNGSCCGQAGNLSEMCVHFLLTLATDAVAIEVQILSGVASTDGLMFQLGCNETYPIDEIVCLPGGQSLDLIFCQPGNASYVFNIISYSAASLPDGNQDGIPDVCAASCDSLSLDMDECAAVFPGYGPAECTDITVTVLSGVAPFSYLWPTFDTSEGIVVCPRVTQKYTVTVTDANGCTAEASIIVYVIDVNCNGGNGVQICHIGSGQANPVTLCVTRDQVESHLAHGDILGACRENPCAQVGPITERDTTPPIIVFDVPRRVSRPFNNSDDKYVDYIFPNPVIDEMTINFEMPFSQTVVFDIFDTQGRQVDSWTFWAGAGNNTYDFNTSWLGAGLYFVRYGNGREIRSLKFVKLE